MNIEIIIIIAVVVFLLIFLVNKFIINKNNFTNKEQIENMKRIDRIERMAQFNRMKKEIIDEINNTKKNDKINIILCSAKWCGHCTNFKPTWDQLVELFGSKFNFIVYDADNDKEVIKKYQIIGFPTILIERSEDSFEKYQGNRTLDELTNYLNSL